MINKFASAGIKGVALLQEWEVKAALEAFKAEPIAHDFIIIRLVSGKEIPTPMANETEDSFIKRILAVSAASLDEWINGVGAGLDITVTHAHSLAMVQRQQREISKSGLIYQNHVPLIGALYLEATERECCILYRNLPIFPYVIDTGSSHVRVVDTEILVARALIGKSQWQLNEQLFKSTRPDPNKELVRLKIIGDAVRVLAPVRQAVVETALAWPEATVELLSCQIHLENGAEWLEELKKVKAAGPIIEKAQACLKDAATAASELNNKIRPAPAKEGFAKIGKAMSDAKSVLVHLHSLH
ncbi:MAG: hypothetical protein Q8M24_19680 [Pseudolabrys sp.]|nr:hypothetical protein [Pseudolabrys sp.]